MSSPFLTRREAADYLRVSKTTIDRLFYGFTNPETGKWVAPRLTQIRVSQRRAVVSRAELDKLIGHETEVNEKSASVIRAAKAANIPDADIADVLGLPKSIIAALEQIQ